MRRTDEKNRRPPAPAITTGCPGISESGHDADHRSRGLPRRIEHGLRRRGRAGGRYRRCRSRLPQRRSQLLMQFVQSALKLAHRLGPSQPIAALRASLQPGSTNLENGRWPGHVAPSFPRRVSEAEERAFPGPISCPLGLLLLQQHPDNGSGVLPPEKGRQRHVFTV